MTSPNNSDYQEMRVKNASDFILHKVIGCGNFSIVYSAKNVQTNKEFAIKVLLKGHAIKGSKTEHALREYEVLRLLDNSSKYFVHFYNTFQDTDRFYFILSYVKNGHLLKYIKLHKKFNVECTRYYSAELVLALEYLHSKKIVHRDLKLENILFDDNFHIVIVDFSSAKIEEEEQNQANGDFEQSIYEPSSQMYSFAGTSQFVSPEMLQETKSSYSSDLWALGCVVFQMASGQVPFLDISEYIMFQKIVYLEYKFPDDFDERLKDFVEKLIVLEPAKRLGATDEVLYTSLRGHYIFDGVNWDNLGPPPKPFDIEINQKCNESANGILDDQKPGLDSKKACKQSTGNTLPHSSPISQITRKISKVNRKITDLSQEDIQNRLRYQQNNRYNVFVAGNLILKQGFLYKGKGFFRRRRRMFLLTLGPHLYYVDPTTMSFKGEISWSSDINAQTKNFKTFFIHTPNRTYYLKDYTGYAWAWVTAIEQLKEHYFPKSNVGND